MRALRALLHKVEVPKDYETTSKVVRTPILADMIQRVVATLTVNYPTWTRGLMGERERDKTDSSLIEKWLLAGHLKMEQQARRRTFRMLMDSAIADGMGVCQYSWNPTAWSPFPKRKADEQGDYTEDADPYLKRVGKHVRQSAFPFGWKDIDPLFYYFWDSYNGEREVVLIEQVPLAPTARALGVRRNSSEKKWERYTPGQAVAESSQFSSETIELIQHWRKDSVTYTLDREPAKVVKHNWGRLSFFDMAALATHERAPERAYLPVAFAFSELIPFLDRLLTMLANSLYLHAFPRGVLKLSQERLDQMRSLLPQAEQDRIARFASNLSDISSLLTLYPGEDFAFATPPGVNADLKAMIQLVMGMIDTAGIGPVMRGESPGSDASGYLANQLMTAARLAYDPITDNARFLLHDGAEFMLYGVDKLARHPVAVWGEGDEKAKAWLELASKHLDGIYETEAKLEPMLPSNFILEGQFGLMQAQAGAISMYTHREKFLKLQSPEEEDIRLAVERVMSSPQVQAMMDAKIGKNAGLIPVAPPTQPPAPPVIYGPDGQPLQPQNNLPNPAAGGPVTPGIGMPLSPEMVTRQGVPPVPGAVLPGPGPETQPGGSFGRQIGPMNVGQ